MNIGYAVFAKESNLITNSNGILDKFVLTSEINTILEQVGEGEVDQHVFCIKRVNCESFKNGCLLTLLKTIKRGNRIVILGSAISLRIYQVDSQKIINGLKYLFNQLEQNYTTDVIIREGDDLGVILPSPTKDFKLFKNETLKFSPSVTYYLKTYKRTPLQANYLVNYLDSFYNLNSFKQVESLFLTESEQICNNLDKDGLKKLDFIKQKQETLQENDNNIKQLEKEKLRKANKRILIIGIFLMFLMVGVFLVAFFNYYMKNNTSSSIYPVGETVYINYNSLNVNIRKSPNSDLSNIEDVLADGDKVYLIGYDTNTLWAKIKYNDGKNIGYVHNRLVSKKFSTDRVTPIYRDAYVYDSTPLCKAPLNFDNQDNKIITLFSNDKIFIKSKIKEYNAYSVRVYKNSKIYNGYLEAGTFTYP